MKIKYKHLYAWDLMMGSIESWRSHNQLKAELDNAPGDAIFLDKYGQWHRFSEVTNQSTIDKINKILETIK